ncbi:MAG: CDP-diacylglycerol--serine O-phosphatidyltransferase [Bacteroidales bacterium]|nr:CDP-diacylglycerol--serine O-phosphatidyltransferase [Bacteroidales bacterium]
MKIVKHIPNTITSLNLLCGVLGVICSLEGRIDYAFYLMLAAAVFDFCDGFSARLLKAYSDIGKELDSLSDMVSFGVLPSVMLYCLMGDLNPDCWLRLVPLLIAVFSGLRLAKFNVDERQTENFIGLATPSCAILCGSIAYYVTRCPESTIAVWAGVKWSIPVMSVILSGLLVSEFPMFSLKFKKGADGKVKIGVQRMVFGFCVLIAIVLTVILGQNWSFAVILIILTYILMNLVWISK